MKPRNLPSASRAVAWTGGTSFWRITVNDGSCASAGEAAAAQASRARRPSPPPALTSEAKGESYRESQGLARGHRLRHVEAEPTPVDAQSEVRQPTPRRRQPVARLSAGSPADQPRLSAAAQHHH